MRLFGFEIGIRKAIPQGARAVEREGAWSTIFDGPGGWFQQDVRVDMDRVHSNWVVFACLTLIAGDIGKLSPLLVQWSKRDRIYEEVDSPAVSPLFRRPNGYQTWPKFIQSWILSKLRRGNTYVLKERDNRNVVTAMHVLDPDRVTPLVAPDGSVYYRLQADDLAGIPDEKDPVVPSSEIMHDRAWCLFHPLVGLPPLYASALAATQGLEIQEQSAKFFANASRPSGILMAPGKVNPETQKEIKAYWETNFSGAKRGRVAVLGDGLKYEAMSVDAVDSDLVSQLKMSAEMVCTTFHVPAYKVGVGATPTYQNAEVLNQIYYDDCLQTLIQDAETLIDDGLDLYAKGYNFQFNLEDLLRMDKSALMDFSAKGVERGIFSPNEARRRFNMEPVEGGKSPMVQQQNYSLEALAKRDSSDDPFGKAKPEPAPAPAAPPPAAANDEDGAAATENAKLAVAIMSKFAKATAHD